MGEGDLVAEFEVERDLTDRPGRAVLKNPQDPPAGAADWNMAPSKQARVVLTRVIRGEAGHPGESGESGETPVRQTRLASWGLVPSWAKDPSIGSRMINAKAESLLEKPSFARAAASRRCLVPADGWFEWQVSPTVDDRAGKPRKQPFYLRRADGEMIGFAGLYEFWRDRSAGEEDPLAWLTTFTIVTTAAEPGLDRIHDRQPLVLERSDWERWLDPGTTDPAQVGALLVDQPAGRFDAYPVGAAVGSSRNNGPGLIEPIPRAQLRGVLDPVTGEIIGG